jgi:hypothetical protein
MPGLREQWEEEEEEQGRRRGVLLGQSRIVAGHQGHVDHLHALEDARNGQAVLFLSVNV